MTTALKQRAQVTKSVYGCEVGNLGISNARNGNLEVPVYFLKAKQNIPSEKWKTMNGNIRVYL
jgi:hypothetical protein